MQIWPAIDLRGGKCVRLRQGDYQQETVFDDDPAAVARQFAAAGGQRFCISSTWTGPARDCRSICRPSRRSWRPSTSNASWAAASATSNRSPNCWISGSSRLVIGTSALKDPTGSARRAASIPASWCWGSTPATAGWRPTAGWRRATSSAIELANAVRRRAAGGDRLHRHRHRRHDGRAQRGGDGRDAGGGRMPVVASGGVTTADDVAHWPRPAWPAASSAGRCTRARLTLAEALARAELAMTRAMHVRKVAETRQ